MARVSQRTVKDSVEILSDLKLDVDSEEDDLVPVCGFGVGGGNEEKKIESKEWGNDEDKIDKELAEKFNEFDRLFSSVTSNLELGHMSDKDKSIKLKQVEGIRKKLQEIKANNEKIRISARAKQVESRKVAQDEALETIKEVDEREEGVNAKSHSPLAIPPVKPKKKRRPTTRREKKIKTDLEAQKKSSPEPESKLSNTDKKVLFNKAIHDLSNNKSRTNQ
jgi:hypothetical protein